MKLTEKHVSEKDIDEMIISYEHLNRISGVSYDELKVLLELKQRRAEDRQREFEKCER